ncbi:MAG: hypothetical protein IE934_08870 [Sphingopyxis sp.]|nr:hypothetical protein [Sphingopyxis sp.]
MTDETTQALLPVTVTQADRDLIVTLMRPLAKSAIEHKAIDFIAEGRGDDAEAVQIVAKHRLAHSLPSQADEIAALRARVAELEAENDRLTKAVGSGILGQLLNDEEQDEFVKFIKFLRGSPEAQSVVSNIGGSNDG